MTRIIFSDTPSALIDVQTCDLGILSEKIWSGQAMNASPYRAVVQPARPTGDCPEAAPYYRWHSMHVQVAGRRG